MNTKMSKITPLVVLSLAGAGLAGCWPSQGGGQLPPAEGGEDANVRYEARIAPAHPLRDSILQCYVVGLKKEFEPLVKYKWRNGKKAVGRDAPSLAPRFFSEGNSVSCEASFRTEKQPVRLDSKPVVIPQLTLKSLKPSKVQVAGRVSPLTGKVIATASDVLSFETAPGLEYHKCSFDEARWSKCASGNTSLSQVGGWSELKEGNQSLYVRGVYYTYESGSQVLAFEKENAAPLFDAAGTQLLRAGAPIADATLLAGQDVVFKPQGVDADRDPLLFNIRVSGLDSSGAEVFVREASGVQELNLAASDLKPGLNLQFSVTVRDPHGAVSSEVLWRAIAVVADPNTPGPSPGPSPTPTPPPQPQRWLSPSTSFTLPEDSALRLVFSEGTAFLAGDAGIDTVSLRVTSNPEHGNAGIPSCSAGACSVDYIPNANFFGSDTLSLVLDSPLGTSAPVSVSFTVTNVDDAPTGTLVCTPSSQNMKRGAASRVVSCSGIFDSLDFEAVSYEPVPEENACGFVAQGTSAFQFVGLAPTVASEACITRFRAKDASGTVAASTATVSIAAVEKAMTFSSGPMSVSKTCQVALQGTVSFDLAGGSFASSTAIGTLSGTGGGQACLSGATANATGVLSGLLNAQDGACTASWLVTDSFGITEGLSFNITPTTVAETQAPVPLEWPVQRGADVAAGNQPVLCGSNCSGARALLSSGPAAFSQCALGDDGSTHCWGNGVSGASPAAFNVATAAHEQHVMGLAANGESACFLLPGGNVRCTGNTANSGLFVGTECNNGSALCPTAITNAVSLASGSGFTCALVTQGNNTSLKCFGVGDKGQLGNAEAEDPTTLNDVKASQSTRPQLSRRDAVEVQFVATDKPLAFSTGSEHACALVRNTLNGKTEARCWGANTHRKLGYAITTFATEGVPTTGYALVPVPVTLSDINQTVPTSPVAIAAGGDHTCLLMDTGRVVCWGKNLESQVGVDFNDTGVSFRPRPTTTAAATSPQTGDGYVPGFDGTTHKAIALAAGQNHTCALTNLGAIRCWGSNTKGQLGVDPNALPTVFDATQATLTPPDSSLFVAVAAGAEHTCGSTTSGRTYCWGEAQNGRLGDAGAVLAASTPSHAPTLVRQAATPALEFESAKRSCGAHYSFSVGAPASVR